MHYLSLTQSLRYINAGHLDVYFILCVIIQYYVIVYLFLLNLPKLWPLGTLSVDAYVSLTELIVMVFCFIWLFFTFLHYQIL